jgi:hypothetical protein
MSVTELQVQQGLQTLIRELGAYASADVVINDWSIFDQWVGQAPYVIIQNAHDVNYQKRSSAEQRRYTTLITLVEQFEDWETTYNAFRASREALINQIDSDNNRTANGLDGMDIVEIRNTTPILPKYPNHVMDQEDLSGVEPEFLFQTLGVQWETF